MSEISPQNRSFSGCWPAVPQSHSTSAGPGPAHNGGAGWEPGPGLKVLSSVSGSLSSYNVGLECQGLLWSQPEVKFVKEMNVNQFLELKVFHFLSFIIIVQAATNIHPWHGAIGAQREHFRPPGSARCRLRGLGVMWLVIWDHLKYPAR